MDTGFLVILKLGPQSRRRGICPVRTRGSFSDEDVQTH